jgi:GNAT superfamily N-acetyltransferase
METNSTLHIRLLEKRDIEPIAAAFAAIGWNKPVTLYSRYHAEQEAGQRYVFVAWLGDIFVGYVTVYWMPSYPPFHEANIPEIQDFNVLPQFRRRGFGSRLMDEAERHTAERSAIVGIGVGMYADYGAAQRMYVRRGYIPDGRGLYFNDHFVKYGEQVWVGDGLTLQFTKRLRD